MNLANLSVGESAIIDNLNNPDFLLRLLEMGCLPGELVKVEHKAPFGDPIAISVLGYTLSLRKIEALSISVQKTT